MSVAALAQPGMAEGSALDARDYLLRDASLTVNFQPATDETVRRSRPVQVRIELLDALDAMDAGAAIEVTFFDDAAFTGVFDRHVRRGDDGYTWIGSLIDGGGVAGDVADTGAWFVISVQRGVMVANFWAADGRTFEIRPAAEDSPVYVVHETVQENYAPCSTCAAHAAGLRIGPTPPEQRGISRPATLSSCDPDDGSIIDVMVVYTPAARDWAGGASAIEALAHAAVDVTNVAYNNSQVNTQVRLVHVAETDYTESGDITTDLIRLRVTNDGFMDEVHPLRDEYGADLVAMLNASSPPSCGIAYGMTTLSTGFAPYAFSVTGVSCAVGNLVFAHELGHNFGCSHDRDNSNFTPIFPYAYGYRWTTTAGVLRRSIMAYNPGAVAPHFSNPNVLNGGVPTGIAHPHPQSADNAQAINNAAWTVANFREGLCWPPYNDVCPSVIVVAAGVHPFNNFDATTSGPIEGGGCNVGSDVWFGHATQCSGELTISLCGSSFDTVLAVYGFTCPDSPGQFIACNSNFCGQQSQVTISVTAGEAFRIRVGGSGGAQGEGTLTISCEPTICLGDITGTGVVDVSDLLALLAAWGPCPGCDADLTGDGVVDVSDLLELLANWGPCE